MNSDGIIECNKGWTGPECNVIENCPRNCSNRAIACLNGTCHC